MSLDTSRLGAWADLPFFADDLPGIAARLAADPSPFQPDRTRIFAALELTRPQDTRVVILGQDPYPKPGDANGLAFSVSRTDRLPASLRNIFKEMQADIGAIPKTGDLEFWARQGVLLLNTVLTVPAGDANGHRGLGWQRLAQQVLERLDAAPRAFVLWGRQAQISAQAAANPLHLRITSAHPSPLSAHRGFFGSRPFSKVNAWLTAQGHAPIDWAGS